MSEFGHQACQVFLLFLPLPLPFFAILPQSQELRPYRLQFRDSLVKFLVWLFNQSLDDREPAQGLGHTFMGPVAFHFLLILKLPIFASVSRLLFIQQITLMF